jgi:hypothetical protein
MAVHFAIYSNLPHKAHSTFLAIVATQPVAKSDVDLYCVVMRYIDGTVAWQQVRTVSKSRTLP